jgi:hypothetical protein
VVACLIRRHEAGGLEELMPLAPSSSSYVVAAQPPSAGPPQPPASEASGRARPGADCHPSCLVLNMGGPERLSRVDMARTVRACVFSQVV